MKTRNWLLAASVSAVIPAVSYAQLEEVIVTASKRSESLQDVPVAITAISAEDIERLGASDFMDLATSVPSLSLRSAGPGRTKLNIRGISAATGFAPTVSFYLDEMPIQALSSGSSTSFQQAIIDPKLYDLERIEVLRGPQGTLYGSSSMGGTVRLITAKPVVGQQEGSLNFDLSDTEEGGVNYRANAMANLGTGDRGALRLIASYTDRDGYFDRIDRNTGASFDDDVNTEETTALRAVYRYEFENAYLQPSVFYQETEMDGKPNYYGPENDYEQVALFDAPEPFDDEFIIANLTYGHNFHGLSLLASLSYLERDFDNVEDKTDPSIGVAEDVASSGAESFAVTEPIFADENAEVEDTTIEIRLSSDTDSQFHWLAGFYYKDSETDAGYRMQRGFPLGFSIAGLANTQDKRDYEEYAGFGEITFEFLEDFSVTLGGRYLEYEISQFKEDWGLVFTGPGGVRDTANVTDRDDNDDEIHGKLTTAWHYQEASQVYATVSNGTRPGGFNRTVPLSDDPAQSVGFACQQALNERGASASAFDVFGSDEVVSYEFGWKSELSANVRFNGALYYIQWDDIQQVIVLSGDCGIDLTTNLGEAESRGAELELLAAVTENFTVSLSGSYTDAQLQDDIPEAGVMSGDRLPDVPEWSANVTLDYAIPVDSGEFFGVANWNYVDETLEFIGEAGDDVRSDGVISGNRKPDYDILDLRIGFTSDDNWEWLLYIENVTDEEAIYSYSDALAFNIEAYDRTVRNRPRTFGTSFTYKF